MYTFKSLITAAHRMAWCRLVITSRDRQCLEPPRFTPPLCLPSTLLRRALPGWGKSWAPTPDLLTAASLPSLIPACLLYKKQAVTDKRHLGQEYDGASHVMRLLQQTFPPCRNLWRREHQKEWWGLCISDHSVGSSPITSFGNSLKTCKLVPSALCYNLLFNDVLPGESPPSHCFEFSSCWLTWRLSSSYIGIVSHTPAPCQRRFCRPVSYVPCQLSLFQAEQSVSI